MNTTKKLMAQADEPESSNRQKKKSKKWQLLLLTGLALAIIPRRSSRRADLMAENLPAKDATDADKSGRN